MENYKFMLNLPIGTFLYDNHLKDYVQVFRVDNDILYCIDYRDIEIGYHCDGSYVMTEEQVLQPSKECSDLSVLDWKEGNILAYKDKNLSGSLCKFIKFTSSKYDEALVYIKKNDALVLKEVPTALYKKVKDEGQFNGFNIVNANNEDIIYIALKDGNQYLLSYNPNYINQDSISYYRCFNYKGIYVKRCGTLTINNLVKLRKATKKENKYFYNIIGIANKTYDVNDVVAITDNYTNRNYIGVVDNINFKYCELRPCLIDEKELKEVTTTVPLSDYSIHLANVEQMDKYQKALQNIGKQYDTYNSKLIDLPNNYDFNLFDYILFKNTSETEWRIGQFSHFNSFGNIVLVGGNVLNFKAVVIPYKGNEKLLGK